MSDLSAMSDQDLVHAGLEAERELVAARFRHSTNQLENTAELRVLRRRIARIKTEVRRFKDAVHDRNADDAAALLTSVSKLLDQSAALR